VPVAIAGMHRSGTSMVTRLLNLCGLYLGREEDLVSSAEDNSEGFWENAKFHIINEKILASFEGGWDIPPALEVGWETSPHLAAITQNASLLIEGISQRPVWGWKDPRNSLTLLFWKRLIPNLKIIICLRNPFEVYRSLARRESASSVFSYNLWLTYYQQLLTSAKPEERIFTHYDSFFRDPQSELRRLLNFLELEVSDETINAACQTISTHLRHNHGSIQDLHATNPPSKLLDLYRELCLRAGHIYGFSLSVEENIFLQNIAAEKELGITYSKKNPQKISQELTIVKEEKSRLQQEIVKLREEKALLQEIINNMLTSRSWRLIEIGQKIRLFFIPLGSTREKTLKAMFNVLGLKYVANFDQDGKNSHR
jgi:hypothetical protein